MPQNKEERILKKLLSEIFDLCYEVSDSKNIVTLGLTREKAQELSDGIKHYLNVQLHIDTIYKNPTIEETAKSIRSHR